MHREYIIKRNNVTIVGSGERVLLLANGFGCNQRMWRFLIPLMQDSYKIVSFDYVGSSTVSLAAFNPQKYASLDGYAQDIVDICKALDLTNVVIAGHSVSGIISLLAALQIPDRIAGLVMVCPSPCFLNLPPDYLGGFEKEDLQELMELMDRNYIGWADYLAPLVIGDSAENDHQDLKAELSDSFCSTNPLTAKIFAEATFLSDHRAQLPGNQHPVLLLQSQNDALASPQVGKYMNKNMPQSTLQIINANGHCLHMTHPKETANSINTFISSQAIK